ncbi:hypothetical protein [Streptomyces sp. NBC_00539]|uniref:hypothetical protein n=1 Tax=Streptomyces sp. NBC_00539 TaxID=2975770 RepID=UPI002E80F5E3|nr:hypothetical protein [Streptomyces sp. NBC_00539]WUC62739.1 hypothetical protein OG861_00005 [Streptomyces sp. NBC_00539]WUC68518.1 hypothetical protein OG861_32220 [Streptomyces sp. NBC_00539]WUC68936.1 hypothetical protein OG861_32225 [Streptomyces sp. NBC_00539]WUC69279.1 hypothetical protein OG861_34170 [Streptomyces sp. NBC_00539]
MPITVEFFVAPDDEVAAQVGPRQRRHGFPSFACADFYPDDAVADWEVLLAEGVGTGSRDVVPMKNDGFTVFQLPSGLCSALVQASSGRLVEAAGAWAELAAVKDEGVPAETAVEILTELAGLARTAQGLRQPLYCWYFAP